MLSFGVPGGKRLEFEMVEDALAGWVGSGQRAPRGNFIDLQWGDSLFFFFFFPLVFFFGGGFC